MRTIEKVALGVVARTPGLGEDADHEDLNDVKRHVPGPGDGDFGSADEGDGGGDAGRRVPHLGVDSIDGCFGVALKKRNEPLYLLLRVAINAGTNLDVLRPRRDGQNHGEQRYSRCFDQASHGGYSFVTVVGCPTLPAHALPRLLQTSVEREHPMTLYLPPLPRGNL
jgi:hypothetical protein